MLCQSLTTLHALLSSHLFAIKRRLPLHVLWWTECCPYLVFQKCCTLIEAHNLKTKSSESYKHCGYKKTRTTPYRPQGSSVLESVHSTMYVRHVM